MKQGLNKSQLSGAYLTCYKQGIDTYAVVTKSIEISFEINGEEMNESFSCDAHRRDYVFRSNKTEETPNG